MTATESNALTTPTALPSTEPLALIAPDGSPVEGSGLRRPTDDVVLDLYRAMVIGRRFDAQATTLAKQGRLAVYPSARGQEACQIGAVRALREQDWLFPTYRDSMAIVTRGVDPVETLTLLRGDWHLGYDPRAHRVAPQCTPLATNTVHAVGLAQAATLRHESTVALVLMGDGATSEGDAHEAFNFAAVWRAPVVFLVQNNGFAISVPTSKQSAAPSFAHKGIGYGIPAQFVDGNDAAAVTVAVGDAVERARRGGGPTLIEARTYRVEAHTNADDATRYRSQDEVLLWLARDPVDRLDHYLSNRGSLDAFARQAIADEAESFAQSLRQRMNADPDLATDDLFSHVYADRPDHLRRQAAQVAARVA
jgi:2-oxoisovalerate dehydrogenase E1 component alpha subunit